MATSTSKTDFSQTIETQNENNPLRVASFSSYLNPIGENFVLKLAESFRKSSSMTVGEHQKEIRVFEAEKYFQMKIGEENLEFNDNSSGTPWTGKNAERVDLRPSADAESGWNIHSALIRSSLVKKPSCKQKKGSGNNRFFSGFACRGSCSDRKSAFVDRNIVRLDKVSKKTPQIDHDPIIFNKSEEKNANSENKTSIVKTQLDDDEKPEPARDSIEVFGSHVINKGDISQNLERKLSVLTWDAIPQHQNVLKIKSTAAKSRTSEKCEEDMDSDVSSDLFEIENIKPLFTRQVSERLSCYAPSEASIEWSVVTGSAADFSAVSDFAELKMIRSSAARDGKYLGEADTQKSRPSDLLGCKSYKSVKVVEPACKSD